MPDVSPQAAPDYTPWALRTLQRFYGYDSFRGRQLEVITAILNRRDVLAVMPTGAGKSVCYQIPACAGRHADGRRQIRLLPDSRLRGRQGRPSCPGSGHYPAAGAHARPGQSAERPRHSRRADRLRHRAGGLRPHPARGSQRDGPSAVCLARTVDRARIRAVLPIHSHPSDRRR